LNISSLLDAQRRDRYFARITKSLRARFGKPCESRAAFVFGTQRSGTTMLMHVFHRHRDIEVWDEHRSSPVFRDHRVRSFDVVADTVARSHFPLVCFKPICDSHLINQFVETFPTAHHIWIYRRYDDVAKSALRKFESNTRTIRLVCTGRSGGGWFDEGVSPEVRDILKRTYSESLSDLDLRALVWWARNRIICDSNLMPSHNVTLIKYEALVTAPAPVLEWLLRRVQIPFHPRLTKRISTESVGKNATPPISAVVKGLCDDLTKQLDAAFRMGSPPADTVEGA
jgi:hypothetical protein